METTFTVWVIKVAAILSGAAFGIAWALGLQASPPSAVSRPTRPRGGARSCGRVSPSQQHTV